MEQEHSLARRIGRRYKMDYRWFIEREHMNVPAEIFEALGERFVTKHRSFFPLRVRSVNLNLAIGLTLGPR